MAKAKLSNPEKAAVLIRIIGEEVAAKVMENLNEREIKKIAANMGKLELITPDMVRSVVDEFMRMAGGESGGVLEAGSSYLRKVLKQLLGEEKTERIIREMALPEDGADALGRLRSLDPQTLASLCANEHPQTIALVLAHIDTILAAETLQNLPEKLQGEVVTRMCTIEGVSPEVVMEVAEVIADQIESMGIGGIASNANEFGGVELVAEVLNRINRAAEEKIFSYIDEENPNLVEEIKRLMFVFDDLAKVDDQGIQEIMKEVSTQDLAKALRTANESIQEKIFQNMSDRAVEMLKEEMEYLGPLRLSDVEKAQQAIMAIAFRLKEEGKIFVEGGEDVLV
jgi:flagellar motor switch protein FliG